MQTADLDILDVLGSLPEVSRSQFFDFLGIKEQSPKDGREIFKKLMHSINSKKQISDRES